jgi:putative flippase GtrA
MVSDAEPPVPAGGTRMPWVKETLGPARSSRISVRFARYTLGSVVAVVASEIAFVACYGTRTLGTTASSAVAFVAGAIPNYVLNRSWAWGRRGRVRVGREVVLYAVVSVVSFAAAAATTGWASRVARHFTGSHAGQTAIVAATYLGTYGVVFVLKFVAFQLVIFAGPERRRRDQAPMGGSA